MNLADSWVFTLEEKKLQENKITVVFPQGLPVLLIKKAGRLYALSNKCAHMACGMESGVLKEFTLKCPCHDWRYDIRTGAFLDAAEIRIPVYELKVSEGNIYIKMEE